MCKLEALGLARSLGPAQWSLSENAEDVLRELGERNDIIKRIHRGLTEKGWERGVPEFVLHGETESIPVIGRLVSRGLGDELRGSAYDVIDGVDGRAHHIRLPHLDAAGDSAPGSIVELRRFEDAAGRSQFAIAVRSDLAIETQVAAQGVTWLDRQLVAKEPIALSEGGFGAEVREALNARVDHLVAEGLARRQGQRVVFARDLLDTLRRGELEATAGQLAAKTGLAYQSAAEGEHVAGIYRQRINVASGRFVMIDNGLGFSLVPLVSVSGTSARKTGFGHSHARRQRRLKFWTQAGTRNLRQRKLPYQSPGICAPICEETRSAHFLACGVTVVSHQVR